MLISSAALSDVYRVEDQFGNVVRLFDTPCEQPHSWLKMYSATLKYQGKDYKACWFIVGRDVIIVDEAGDVSKVSMSQFKKELSA